MIADYIVADSYLLARLRRDIADDIIAGLFILFDVDSEHEDHSDERLFFVGYIVNFVVSSLICMFQDSVPAGSYNDPFLSSVCVSACADMHIHMHIDKQPGGWETALAVKHFLKKNSSGAVAPRTFYDEHYRKFSRGKFNDFEGMT